MRCTQEQNYKAIVIGASAGGFQLMPIILEPLPKAFPVPIIIIQHMKEGGGAFMVEYLNERCRLPVNEATQFSKALPGHVYLAPSEYHLYIDDFYVFSLSVDAKVRFSRPSIDVFFESASKVYASNIIGVLLTGANNDGAEGMKTIKSRGGLTIVQDPATAEAKQMPASAIAEGAADHILPPDEITPLLIKMVLKKVEWRLK